MLSRIIRALRAKPLPVSAFKKYGQEVKQAFEQHGKGGFLDLPWITARTLFTEVAIPIARPAIVNAYKALRTKYGVPLALGTYVAVSLSDDVADLVDTLFGSEYPSEDVNTALTMMHDRMASLIGQEATREVMGYVSGVIRDEELKEVIDGLR